MDVDEIEFSDWQIEKIRSALRRYRTISKHMGRLPSWRQVRDDIVFSDSNVDKYAADDAELIFKEESLRRFGEAVNDTMSIERLRDATRFLLDEELLTPETFQEDRQDLAAFLAMHEYFANDYEDAQSVVSAFSGIFTYKAPYIRGVPGAHTITLHLIPDAFGKYVHVEEVIESLHAVNSSKMNMPNTRRRAKESDFISKSRRKGFGFPITRLNILHIFLEGVTPSDRMTYIQAGELHKNYNADGFFLMRNGEETGRDQWEHDSYYEEPVILPNVFRFVPERMQER